ncbi:glycosyl hydrolase family 18 protein [Syntrophomonas wolfei]|uniref:glycosyl hydrolase family 18 protein n=1 Tax=Syntrophomonas wolfei TaxID=863 RepID=UPI0023F50604|nr:glycosyl hydrolase family 18 protein [Syntrophomonas wolfei]
MKRTKTKWTLVTTLLIISLFTTTCFADEIIKKEIKKDQFKVVGYYSGDLFNEPVEKLQTDKLTHVIYAFLIPQEDGTLVDLEKPEQLKQLVSQAHNDGAEVFIALGGWSYQGKPLAPVFEAAAASQEKTTLLIDNICALVEEYDLDGVELDWEHPNVNSIADYERLAVELKTALDLQNKELTAALNGAWSATEGPEVSKLITNACLESFSFVNVMAYDMNNEDHSPAWFAETSVDYWLNRGIPADKIVLGMPLYARPSWLQYRHLVEQNPQFAYSDYAPTVPLESYYNGLNTLREKTLIALKQAGGVMLFDVNADSGDKTSVILMINDILSRTKHLSKDELNKYITVIIDNKELVFLEEEGFGVPFIDENNRTLIPLRKPLEAIGATVSYDERNHMVKVEKDGTNVKLPIGENIITLNGQEVKIDTKSIIKDGRTYIPLRAVLAAFGYDIEWHGNSATILILNNSKE